jgi:hypothetical protein
MLGGWVAASCGDITKIRAKKAKRKRRGSDRKEREEKREDPGWAFYYRRRMAIDRMFKQEGDISL